MTGLSFRYTTRAKVLVILLALSFLLMCVLAWQAFQSTSQHRQIADKVVSEYAQLATEEFSRRIMADIGYRGYFQLITQWREYVMSLQSRQDKEIDVAKRNQSNLCQDDNLASYFFFTQNNETLLFDQQCQKHNSLALQNIINQFDKNKIQDQPFAFIHTVENNNPISIVISKLNQNQLLGFVINRQTLAQKLEQAFNKSPLLPRVLAEGKASNQLLNLHVSDHSGKTLLGKVYQGYDYITATKKLGEEYSGIFNNHQINIAININNANQLIIGGFPKNNLPLLTITILVTLLVFITSLLQLKKEHQLNQLRESFIAEVSHELRTPLTQIRLFAEMLLHGRTRSEHEFQNYLEIINRETLRLNHLINNLLKYSERQALSPPEMTDISIVKLVEEVVADYSLLLKQKRGHIRVELEECFLTLDPESTKRVISNILDNALKYGPDNQTISISSKLNDGTNAASYHLIIDDQGPGIPDTEKQSVWLPYFRLPRESKVAIAGTGIGLYLVKQLVQKMNGNVWVEDNQQGGCRFILEWPFNGIKEV